MEACTKDNAPPLRSVLFVRGDDEAAVRASPTCGADAIVLDIEEPRTPFDEAQRQHARNLIREFFDSLGEAPQRPKFFVRVQALDTHLTLRDLRGVMHPALFGIILPKVSGASDIIGADALLAAVEMESGRTVGSTSIYPILETAVGMRNAYDIGCASPRVQYLGGLVSRLGDVQRALGYRWTRAGMETFHMRSQVLLDAKAAGVRYPISGMWNGRVDDIEGLTAWANQLRDLGYCGMMIGDAGKSYVQIVNDIFSPTAEELAYWLELDRLMRVAEQSGSDEPVRYGEAVQGQGHVVHMAYIKSARHNLAWARALGLLDRDETSGG
jgi:citrate lyase subunit beta/citryl-CoA lyase